jgi:hypothetical protein
MGPGNDYSCWSHFGGSEDDAAAAGIVDGSALGLSLAALLVVFRHRRKWLATSGPPQEQAS